MRENYYQKKKKSEKLLEAKQKAKIIVLRKKCIRKELSTR